MRHAIRLLCATLLLVACGNPIEKYYSGGRTQSDATVLEYLQANAEYSSFVELLERTGLIEQLRRGTLMTVMAPVNETMPASIAGMTDMELRLLANNHLCLTMLYTRTLQRLEMVRTLAGKSLDVEYSAGGYRIDGVALDRTDVVCSDGVVHRAVEWLVPRLNLLQWIENLPDSYSMLRDSILACNTRRFDREHSQIIGVDESGRVIYDSVWIVDNYLLNNADLGSESVRYTLMAPSNATFEAMYAAQTGYLADIEYPVTHEDTVAWTHWTLTASLYEGVLDYEPGHTFTSVKGNQLRTDYNEVADAVNMSNGRAYRMNRSYVPRSMYAKQVTFNPYYTRRYKLPTGNNCMIGADVTVDGVVYDKYGPAVNNTNSVFLHAGRCLYWQYSSNVTTDGANFYQFTSAETEWEADAVNTVNVTSIAPLKIFPCKYNVRMQLLKNTSDNVTNTLRVYNLAGGVETLIGTPTNITAQLLYESPNGEAIAGNVQLNSKYEPVTLVIRVPGTPTAGPNRRIAIGNVILVPTGDNY